MLKWCNHLLTECGGKLLSPWITETPQISTLGHLRNKARDPGTIEILAGNPTGFGNIWLRTNWMSHRSAGSDWVGYWWNITRGPKVSNFRAENKSSGVVNSRKYPSRHSVLSYCACARNWIRHATVVISWLLSVSLILELSNHSYPDNNITAKTWGTFETRTIWGCWFFAVLKHINLTGVSRLVLSLLVVELIHTHKREF